MVRSWSLKCSCSSASTRCQLMSACGPSMKPSRETWKDRMIFRKDPSYPPGFAKPAALTNSIPTNASPPSTHASCPGGMV